MHSRRTATSLVGLTLDRGAPRALHLQIYSHIRSQLLCGALKPHTLLPATRVLARELGCARNTVAGAYEQLYSEGYLYGHVGSGTYISPMLPDDLLTASPAVNGKANGLRHSPDLSKLGRLHGHITQLNFKHGMAFEPSQTDISVFPFDTWARLLNRHWRRPSAEMIRCNDAKGYPPLREAVASYLCEFRGLTCTADQVMITAGTGVGIGMAVRFLLEPGEEVWIEDPCNPPLRALASSGVGVVPVPVDTEGLIVEEGKRLAPEARIAIVTPSHHFPLGHVMSLSRRLALLDWARGVGGWILEDDYDGEFRYSGRPLAALHALDDSDRVLYFGTFSKIIFPSVRLGYIAGPAEIIDLFAGARWAFDFFPSIALQPVLASFIEDGSFAAHIRRLRKLYERRQNALVAAAAAHLSGLLDVSSDPAGMHLIARLTDDLARRMSDREASRRAAARGITARPLSNYYYGKPESQGLLLGYAAVSEKQILESTKLLAAALREG